MSVTLQLYENEMDITTTACKRLIHSISREQREAERQHGSRF